MRLYLVAATSLAIAAVSFACSSSDAPPATGDSSNITNGPSEAGAPVDETPAEVTPPAEDLDAGPTSDSAPQSGSTTGDAGAQCQGDSIREAEGNDTEATANLLEWKTGSVCGQLSGTDVDFFTFTIPQTQNGFQFNFGATPRTRGYTITCTVDGQTFDFNTRRYPFVVGKPYVCKVALNAGTTSMDYRINMNVQAF
jgi:hypothetical protein